MLGPMWHHLHCQQIWAIGSGTTAPHHAITIQGLIIYFNIFVIKKKKKERKVRIVIPEVCIL